MGYLRKGMVIDALREDVQVTKEMCYEGCTEKEIVKLCYTHIEHEIDRLPQYYPENVVEETRWIPVSERLPEHGKYEEDDIGETFYLSEDMPCEDFGIVVEAWRPLPEPYKE